jgi:membrane protein implicated in regulation of membrane protease activity
MNDSLFWVFTYVGSGLFLIQFFLNLFGADDDADSGKFKWLLKQGLTGFFLMFGLVGLTCQKEFSLSLPLTLIFAGLAGLGAVLMAALLFKGAKKLRSTGTVFRIEDALGKEAVVYQSIPNRGVGKISISLNDFTHELDAQADEDIPSFDQVSVIKIIDKNTVFVTRGGKPWN